MSGKSITAMCRFLVALLLACTAVLAGAEELQPVPVLTARVTDLTAALSAEQRGQLDAKLAAFEQEKGAQIAVLLVPTTQPEAIEQYSIRVVEQWKLGRKGVDDGVLLLVAKQDRKLRIEVGYGLEGALNDATARRIIAETITPQFRERRFFEGIDAGVERIMGVVRGEALPPPKAAASNTAEGAGFDIEALLVIGLVLVTVVAGILRTIFGRFFGAAIVGGVAGAIVMFIVSSLFFAVLAAFVAFMVALLSGGRAGGWGGGYTGGGSWGGSGGDSGGFSGGGGDFGGGGASGDW